MHLWSTWKFFLGIYAVPQVTMSPQRYMLSYLGQFLVFFTSFWRSVNPESFSHIGTLIWSAMVQVDLPW